MLDPIQEARFRVAVREGWGDWLSGYTWDHFVTLTFKKNTGPDIAMEEFALFVRRLGRSAELPIYWFVGFEDGPLNGRLHIHALLGNTRQLSIEFIDETWRVTPTGMLSKRNGYTRILPYNPRLGAAYYCAKYVTKKLMNYDLSGHFIPSVKTPDPQLYLFEGPLANSIPEGFQAPKEPENSRARDISTEPYTPRPSTVGLPPKPPPPGPGDST